MLIPFLVLLLLVVLLVYLTDPAKVETILRILALLLVATVPALIEAGGSSLRGLGWLVVVIAAVVLLIDLTDRLGEWVERRRWGRRR